MKSNRSRALLAAITLTATLAVQASQPVQFATSVVSYSAGGGVGVGYDNPSRALGAPTFTDPYGFGPITPFNPSFLESELVSIGEGGHLTLCFDKPIFNRAENPFGIDFIIYGNEGFVDYDWPNGLTGPGAEMFSDLFGVPPVSVVSVSYDNITFYDLLRRCTRRLIACIQATPPVNLACR